MDYQLVVLRGRSVSSAVKLADGVTTAGRAEECQLRIKSSQVSRKHCQFFEKNGMLLVKDLGSSNGTFVNSEKIQGQRVLEPGDEVAVGPISFRIEKIGVVTPPETKLAPAKAADTAITKGVATKEAVPDDEFEIIFDEEPAGIETVALSDENAILLVEPTPAPVPVAPAAPVAAASGGSLASARKTPPPPKPAPAPAPPPKAAEPEFADDAVADFLLDLKIDEDE